MAESGKQDSDKAKDGTSCQGIEQIQEAGKSKKKAFLF